MEFYSKSIILVTLIICGLLLQAETVPLNKQQLQDTKLTHLLVRFRVLKKVVSSSNMKLFTSLCNVAKSAEIIYRYSINDSLESSRLMASSQLNDTCNWMLTHAIGDSLDCDTVESSISTITIMCGELTQYEGIDKSLDDVVESLSGQVTNPLDELAFAEEFSESLSEPVKNIICGSYGC